MVKNYPFSTYFILLLITITRLISIVSKTEQWKTLLPPKLPILESISHKFQDDPGAIKLASKDYGNLVHDFPLAVFHPSSIYDIVSLVKHSYNSSIPFNIAARGQGHSTRGQAMASDGVVVDMAGFRERRNGVGISVVLDPFVENYYYADVGGEQLWIDVLHKSLEYGLAPVSWTDYLYLTVGGKGDFVTCSLKTNSELFHAVLGGLGQFGIITRARIALEPAPGRVKWVRLLYNDFSAFTKDQEQLISINGRRQKNALDYLEGILIMHQGPINNWRSSFFPLADHPRIISLVTKHSVLYCLELAKYHDGQSHNNVDKEFQVLMQGLNYLPGFNYEKDVSYVEFLNRVRSGELKLQSQGLWDVPHPWLNLFIPKSQILEFDSAIFKNIILKRNITTGPVLIYPMNRNK
ncbi:unnamed protein product [Lupinus luteus]|uniref:Cytokinin dehydrogenase 1 FAD/cytokinin binding domain-containing protein n=1 Tax=Lupinus luteus TaxID=3873 RepID=A0AAV1W601_LUPLU